MGIRTRDVIIPCLAFLGGFLIAYGMGFDRCVDIGLKFLEVNGVKVEINGELIKLALQRYYGHF